jgi:hypothetical protein
METSLKDNSKIVVPTGSDLVNVMGEMGGVLPINSKKDRGGSLTDQMKS